MSMDGMSKHHLQRKSEIEIGEHSKLSGVCGREREVIGSGGFNMSQSHTREK